MPIPPVGKKSVFEGETLAESTASVGSVLGAVQAAWKLFSLYGQAKATALELGFQILVMLVVVSSAAMKVVRAKRKDRRGEKSRDGVEYRACLVLIHQFLVNRLGLEADPQAIRTTLYRVEFEADGATPKHLQQVTDYVGGPGGAKGRILDVSKGIVGKAARTRQALAERQETPDAEGCYKHLMEVWGYTEAEARAMRVDRLSWMAVPLPGKRPSEVVGVLFLDSTLPNAFDDDDVQNVLHLFAASMADIANGL